MRPKRLEFGRYRPLLLVGTLIAVGAVLPADARAGESVRLRFDWPDDLSGRVVITQSSVSERGDDPATELETRGTARFSVSPVGEDLVIAFEGAAFESVTNTTTGLNRQLSELFTPITTALPDYRVDGDGRFVGLEQPAAFLQSVLSAIEPIAATIPPEELEILRPTIKQAASRGEFERMAQDRWQRMVSRWVGRELRADTPIVESEQMTLPMVGGGLVPAETSFCLAGHVPCGPSGPDGCVELEMRTIAEGPAAVAAYTRLLQRDGGYATAHAFHYDVTIRTISDPDTLVPYQRRTDWTLAFELDSYPGTVSVRQSGSHAITYDYD